MDEHASSEVTENSGSELMVVDITGLPCNRSALIELAYGVASAKARGARVIAVRHGIGTLQKLARRAIREYVRERRAIGMLPGEKLFREDNCASLYMTERYASLAAAEAVPEITYIAVA